MVPFSWRRFVRLTRLLLGLGCVAVQVLDPPHSSPFRLAVLGAYCAYAAILIWRSPEESGRFGVVLAIDGAVLLFAIASNSRLAPIPSIPFYAFVLFTAVTGHDWWRPVVLAALCIVTLNFLQPATYPILFPALAGAGILATALSLERQVLIQRLDATTRQSVLYRYDAEKAREAERQRIAADFHDGPLQSFISFQMRLEIILRLLHRDTASAEEEVIELQELTRAQVLELRAFVRSMRPADMEGSLTASIRKLVEQFQKDSGVAASFVSTDFIEPAEADVSVDLIQTVREALHNIQKHAGATRVSVAMSTHDRVLEISIEDNGRGFPFSGRFTLDELELLRLGPGSIKRRVRALGGELLLDSKPGTGSSLRVRLQT